MFHVSEETMCVPMVTWEGYLLLGLITCMIRLNNISVNKKRPYMHYIRNAPPFRRECPWRDMRKSIYHPGLVTPKGVANLYPHRFGCRFALCSSSIVKYQKQCWLFVSWTIFEHNLVKLKWRWRHFLSRVKHYIVFVAKWWTFCAVLYVMIDPVLTNTSAWQYYKPQL